MNQTLLWVVRIILFLAGLAIVLRTLLSAIRMFVVPRGVPDQIAGFVFSSLRRVFDFFVKRQDTYEKQDWIMAFYAPVALIVMAMVWLFLILFGFTWMFWGIGYGSMYESFLESGSSLLTLGYAPVSTFPQVWLSFLEAMLGLLLVALFMAYLPTMYNGFSHRESLVTRLEVRAGSPPSPVEILLRAHRLGNLHLLGDIFADWETWFAEVEESHTSLAALVFFRSPKPQRSWVTASGVILDAAALHRSTLDIPTDVRADTCIRAGYIALREIATFFGVPYDSNPSPDDPISVTKEEFLYAYHLMKVSGMPVVEDREQAWKDYAGWRVNYDSVLVAIARITFAPPAPWSTDRLDRVERQPLTTTLTTLASIQEFDEFAKAEAQKSMRET